MGAQEIQVFLFDVDAFGSLKTDCNASRLKQIYNRCVVHEIPIKKTRREVLQTKPNVET